MNDDQATPKSHTQSLTERWEAEEQALIARLRASGRKVTIKEFSGSTELVASFPQGKPSSHRTAVPSARTEVSAKPKG